MKRIEIQKAIKDKKWQEYRLTLKGLTTKEKMKKLKTWLIRNNNSDKAKIQVKNYENALKRGGLL